MSITVPNYWKHLVLKYTLADILEDLKIDAHFHKENIHAFDFFKRLHAKFGVEGLNTFLFAKKDLIDTCNSFERVHLSSDENIIFTLVEAKYYPERFKKRFGYLDVKIWLPVAIALGVEGIRHLGIELLKDANLTELATSIEHHTRYSPAIETLACCIAIGYEFRRDHLEENILKEIGTVSKLLAASLPTRIWNAPSQSVFSSQFNLPALNQKVANIGSVK